MRHFGESAQSTLQEREPSQMSLASLIHSELSPANLYERPVGGFGAAQSARRDGPENAQPKTLRSVLPPFMTAGSKAYEIIKGDPQPDLEKIAPLNFTPPQAQTVEKPITALPQVQTPAAHPLLALLRKPEPQVEVKFPVPGLNNSEEKRIGGDYQPLEAKLGVRSDIVGRDPFSAPNCYQSFQINTAEGWSRTVTTLPDLSASKIETRYPDRLTITYADKLGRPEKETVLDKQGNLLTETISRFDHAASPTSPSQKLVRTANETIALTLDAHGNVISRHNV